MNDVPTDGDKVERIESFEIQAFSTRIFAFLQASMQIPQDLLDQVQLI
jgi:hypothetical protein